MHPAYLERALSTGLGAFGRRHVLRDFPLSSFAGNDAT
jgi:hypothetical protein